MERKCSFCGEGIKPGAGKMNVLASGATQLFCSSKCEKNSKLGRSARKVKWTADYRKEKEARVHKLTEAKKEAPAEKAEKKGSSKAKAKKK